MGLKGHIKDKIRSDTEKKEATVRFPLPETREQVKSFQEVVQSFTKTTSQKTCQSKQSACRNI